MRAPTHRTALRVALGIGVVVVAAALAVHLDGAEAGLPYLGPATFAFVLLALGRYPGERVLLGLTQPVRRRLAIPALRPCGRQVTTVPRGGLLLASALAGRAPPASRWPP
jgi:hypothetical protein